MVEPEGATLRSARLEDFNMEYILSSDQKLRGTSRNSGNKFADTLLYIVNGYFFSEVFDSNTPVIKDQNTRGSREWYYQYNLSNITNIHR